jgi:hypothetical protein
MHGDSRLDDLLLSRATEGLSKADTLELTRLLELHPEVDEGAYERTAAAIMLAALRKRRALPGGLRAKLERSAAEFAAKVPRTER